MDTPTDIYQVVGQHPDLPGLLQVTVLADDVHGAISAAIIAVASVDGPGLGIGWPAAIKSVEQRAQYLADHFAITQVMRVLSLGVDRIADEE